MNDIIASNYQGTGYFLELNSGAKCLVFSLSAFSFSLTWSIQDFIVANVALSFSFVHFSFCVSEAGNDFLSDWSSTNSFMIISSGTTLSIKTL